MEYILCFILGFVVGIFFLAFMISAKRKKLRKIQNKSRFHQIIEQSKDL